MNYADLDSEGKAEARDLALLAAQIRSWAGPDKTTYEEALTVAWDYFGGAAAFMANQVVPTLTALNPATLEVPGPDSEIAIQGTGFNPNTVINWNGGDEVTDFISETEVRTTVKPSTVAVALPFTLPVYVHHGTLQSNVLEFTFTEAPVSESPLRSSHGKQDRA